MCAIAGVINFDGRLVDLDLIKIMTSQMTERGPDDEGYFIDGHCGLGFRRLSIIDIEGGHQPIPNEDATLQLVFNGEIYNHVELRQQLLIRGHRFRTNSDAEVLLHLYEDFGVDALRKVNGMFAFAIYDIPRGRVFIARDRLGIKPLVYFQDGNRLIFASDVRGLHAIIPLTVSREMTVEYLFNSYVPEPFSIWNGVRKLPAAHYMLVGSDGEISTKSYWRYPVGVEWEGTEDEARKSLNELLQDSTALQMRSDVPVGIFLSGGVDSSAVVAYAASSCGETLRTYSVDFLGKHSADAGCARQVSKLYGTNHTELTLGPADMLSDMDEMLQRFDEPVSDSAVFAVYAISKLARQNGVKVLLNGAGGDEIFGGYTRYWPPRFGSPRWVSEYLPAVVGKPLSALWRMTQPSRGWAAADPSFSWAQSLSGVDFGALKSLLRSPIDFVNGLHALKTYYPIRRDATSSRLIYPLMTLDLNTYLIGNVLALIDKASMAASVECRVPLLDHRLVEFALSLPERVNFLGGVPKGIFKETLGPRLPPDILRRSKEGFNAPISVWFDRNDGKIRDELLGAGTALIHDIIERSKLEAFLRRASLSNHSQETIFSLFMLNRWCRIQGAS